MLYLLQKRFDAVLIGSAGNRNSNTREYPAAFPSPGCTLYCPEVLGVAGLKKQVNPPPPPDCRWVDFPAPGYASNYSSQSDPWTELASFADDIWTLYFPDSLYPYYYREWSGGTSFAAPIVSGLAHLMESYWPADDHTTHETFLQGTSIPYACQSDPAYLPRGRVDFLCALQKNLRCREQ